MNEQDSDDCSNEREQQRFTEQQADEAETPGAECMTHGNLAHTLPSPRQHEDGDVRASDEQEEPCCRKKQSEDRDVCGSPFLVYEAAQPDAEVTWPGVRAARCETLIQLLQFRFCR